MWGPNPIPSVLGSSRGAYIPSKVIKSPRLHISSDMGPGGPKYRGAHFTSTPVLTEFMPKVTGCRSGPSATQKVLFLCIATAGRYIREPASIASKGASFILG